MTWFDSNRLHGNSIKSLAPDPFAPSFPFGGHPEGYIERIERESKETAEMFARQQENINKKYEPCHKTDVSKYHPYSQKSNEDDRKEKQEPIMRQAEVLHNYSAPKFSSMTPDEKNRWEEYKRLCLAIVQSENNERRNLFYKNASECFAMKAKQTVEKYEKYTQVISIRNKFNEELDLIYFRAMDYIISKDPPKKHSDFENYLTSVSINLIEKPIDKFFRSLRINYIKFLFNKHFK